MGYPGQVVVRLHSNVQRRPKKSIEEIARQGSKASRAVNFSMLCQGQPRRFGIRVLFVGACDVYSHIARTERCDRRQSNDWGGAMLRSARASQPDAPVPTVTA